MERFFVIDLLLHKLLLIDVLLGAILFDSSLIPQPAVVRARLGRPLVHFLDHVFIFHIELAPGAEGEGDVVHVLEALINEIYICLLILLASFIIHIIATVNILNLGFDFLNKILLAAIAFFGRIYLL